jgi:ABC-type antimicrobial peptide transport system, permease component
MLQHHLLVVVRYLRRTRLYTFINIIGLAAAITACVLIGLWVRDELTFNKSFDHYDRIAQVYHNVVFGGETMTINDVPAALGETLKTQVAGLEDVAITSWPQQMVVTYDGNSFTEDVMFVDPTFTSMFDLKACHGTSSLSGLNSVLVSRHLADKILAGDAVGKAIRLKDGDELMVSGVYENFPANSSFAGVDVIASLAYHFSQTSHAPHDWEAWVFQCYLLLDHTTSLLKVQDEMRSILYNHVSNDGKALRPEGVLLAMRDWHLKSAFREGRSAGGRIQLVRQVAVISAIVILMACMNFINLTTALGHTRAKEIGIRKVIGSHQWDLIKRFLLEAFVIVIIAYGVALVMASLMMPWFNVLSEKQIVFPFKDLWFWGTSGLFVVVVSLLAGSIPASLMVSQNVNGLLKKQVARDSLIRRIPLRKFLVIFQFSAAVVLIISSQVIYNQIRHARNRPAGFETDGIIHLPVRTEQLASLDYNTLRNHLLSTDVVDNMAKSDFPITGSMTADASLRWEGMQVDSPPLFARNRCSHDFPATHGFQFVLGRDFSRDHPSDSSAVIINEMAARLIGGDVLGKKISFGYGKEREIIGVIKDQIRWGPYHEQSPHLYYLGYDNWGYYSIRLKSGARVADALVKIESVFARYAPGAPFDFAFVGDDYNNLFIAERRAGNIAFIFSGLAILISCVGIFGLAAFSASRRTKEIGVRKVVGASSYQIWKLLSAEFLGLSLIASLVAFPIAYYAADAWLNQFSYRTNASWIVYAIAAVAAVSLTLITVSYQTLRAAHMNPAKSLRTD